MYPSKEIDMRCLKCGVETTRTYNMMQPDDNPKFEVEKFWRCLDKLCDGKQEYLGETKHD